MNYSKRALNEHKFKIKNKYERGSAPMSVIGVKIAEGRIVPVFNTEKKNKRQEVFTTIADQQTKAAFEIYCRDKSIPEWFFIKGMMLEGILPSKAGEPELELNVTKVSDGSLLLSVLDDTTSKNAELQIYPVELAEKYKQMEVTDSSHIETAINLESTLEGYEIEDRKPSKRKRFYISLIFVIFIVSILLFIATKFQFITLSSLKKWPVVERRIENIFEKRSKAEHLIEKIHRKGLSAKHRLVTTIEKKKLLLEPVKDKLKESIQGILPEEKTEEKKVKPSGIGQSEEKSE